jgi:hypothetical protein
MTNLPTTTPFSVKAGSTKFFTITTYDLYGNLEVSSYNTTDVSIYAQWVQSNAYVSPLSLPDLANWDTIYGKDVSGIALDNGDGTYASQFTIYRAGTFTLGIQIDRQDV